MNRQASRSHYPMSASQTPNLRDSVCIALLSFCVALMYSTFVVRVIHTHLTSAGWEDSLDSNDPIATVVTMIAISSVIYNLLTKIKNRYGLIASFEGACWLIGALPVLFWIIHTGRVFPDISDYPYLGLWLVVAAICLAVIRSRRLRSTLPLTHDKSRDRGDSEIAEVGSNEPPHESTSERQRYDTRAKRWMLVAAAGSAIAVSALVPRSFPLLDTEGTVDPDENCRNWYDDEVVSLYKGSASLWVAWSESLKDFVNEPARKEQFLAEIEASDSLTDLVDRRSEAISTWKAAQEDLDVEIDIALLDDHWDSDELRRIVAVRLPEMQGLIDLITLNTLLADAAGFYPFPDSQELETDLKRAALGLEKACHRRRG